MASKIAKPNGKRKSIIKLGSDVLTSNQIASLAKEIATYLPRAAAASLTASKNRFSRRKGKTAAKYPNPIVVDTSVLIDGRVLDVAKSGFLMGTLLVLPSVISELHSLSDSRDDLKRAKGRRGLDVLADLLKLKQTKVVVLETEPKEGGVDEKIVKIAKNLRGRILTLDFNLSKVAKVKNLQILSLNELANAVKTSVLPHESIQIQIKAKGKGEKQGVGYLEDGTMVVVEGGANLVGKTVNVDVARVIQTLAGKMIFGKIAPAN